ncbi:recombination and DNA strand exchange inhibitor protein [archaeon BMS3Abin16]|nr:recombination and DNA strand exchange inhibitor protein [archaeon BMS3Abin16]HDY73978.1 hypothetical protein [Euryarchaeota archaeon]
MFESLSEVKGVGEKIRGTLTSHYGSEEAALKALQNGEYEGLIAAGITLPKAVEIARFIESKRLGFSYANALKTGEAREIYSRIMDVLRSYPQTDYGKVGVGLFHPTLDKAEIARRNRYTAGCAGLVRRIGDKTTRIQKLLKQITPLAEGDPTLRDLIATEDPEIFSQLKSALKQKGNIIFVEDLSDLEFFRDSEFVRYVQRNAIFAGSALELECVEPVYEDDLLSIAPEIVLSFYGANRECILAAIELAAIAGDPEMKNLSKPLLSEVETISRLSHSGVDPGISRELKSLKQALDQIDSAAQKALELANKAVTLKMSEMSLDGRGLLELLRTAQSSALLSSLPGEFTELVETEAHAHEGLLADTLELDKRLLHRVFSTDNLPLELDTDRLTELKEHLSGEQLRLEYTLKKQIAGRLSDHTTHVKGLVRKAMELDLRLAVGQFTIDYSLKPPVIQNQPAVSFTGGRNIFLKGEIQPINYVVGGSTDFPGHGERAVVITGANSGGKTTLLELILQTAVLAQTGFGVPCEKARSTLFQEIYYFGKAKGDDAGAFETLLKTFEGISKTQRKRIILADEIESITEPGAAAKILAGLLDWFKEDENTLIAVVTHLGEDIKEQVGAGVRIDGIEATGLDETHNLIVDRNPTLGMLAKSTPELILDRLSRKADKQGKGLYRAILERFKK